MAIQNPYPSARGPLLTGLINLAASPEYLSTIDSQVLSILRLAVRRVGVAEFVSVTGIGSGESVTVAVRDELIRAIDEIALTDETALTEQIAHAECGGLAEEIAPPATVESAEKIETAKNREAAEEIEPADHPGLADQIELTDHPELADPVQPADHPEPADPVQPADNPEPADHPELADDPELADQSGLTDQLELAQQMERADRLELDDQLELAEQIEIAELVASDEKGGPRDRVIRWPGFADLAPRLGLRASVSVPLHAGFGPPVAALTVYGRDPGAMAPLIGGICGVRGFALPYTPELTDEGGRELVAGYAEALAVRERIHRALAVIMKEDAGTVDEAYVTLCIHAAHHGTDLAAAAAAFLPVPE